MVLDRLTDVEAEGLTEPVRHYLYTQRQPLRRAGGNGQARVRPCRSLSLNQRNEKAGTLALTAAALAVTGYSCVLGRTI